MNGLTFADTLRGELVDAARRNRTPVATTRRRRWAASAVAVALAATIAVLVVAAVAPAPTADAAVRIETVRGRVVVTLTDLEAGAAAVEHRLRRAGLAVDVESVPVGPSKVGRFLGERGSVPPELAIVRPGDDATFVGFSVPVGWRGHVVLDIGRRARPGEPYGAFSDAYARGEPLACSGAYGRRATDVTDVARRRGLDLVFQPIRADDVAAPPVPGAAIARSPHAKWIASDAVAVSARRVVVVLTADGTSPTAGSSSPTSGCPR